ncbi:MAG: hypothetical protein WCV69_00225 [Patescibacteria group bacterium]|jgi:hypothetical protein
MNKFEQNFPTNEPSREKERPPILYHASVRRDITEFEPRAESVREPKEGPVIFATSDLGRSSMFLVPVDHSWTQKNTINGVHLMIISDRERFLAADKGGAIYTLPPEGFNVTNEEHRDEWTNNVKVKPSDKIEFDSALEAMLSHGVQVYFVDPETLEAIRSSSDHGLAILRKQKSENEKLGKNFINLPSAEENS